MLKVVLGHEQRLGNTDPTLIPGGYLEALGPQVYWTVNLYITRFLYIFAPYEVIHSADALVKEMHKDLVATTRISSPIDIYSLSLATLTLLEASKLPLCAEFCWKILGNIEQILDRRAQATATAGEFDDLFSTPQWDRQLRAWIEVEKSQHSHTYNHNQQTQNQHLHNNQPIDPEIAADRPENSSSSTNPNPSSSSTQPPPPLVGPNEQRSLQHLADLAVGAEGGAGNGGGDDTGAAPQASGPGGMDVSNDETGGAGGAGLGLGGGSQGGVAVDFSVALRRGFMNVLSMAPGDRH
jgi:hypothetical protein